MRFPHCLIGRWKPLYFQLCGSETFYFLVMGGASVKIATVETLQDNHLLFPQTDASYTATKDFNLDV